MRSKIKDGYFTRAEITKQIKQVVAKAHGLEPSDILLNFVTPWRQCKFPTGLVAKCASIVLRSDGFRAAKKTLTQIRNKRWHLS